MTQLAPRTESFGAGDQSWLGSRHGTDVAKSVTLDPSSWSGRISDGRIKSGEPFKMSNGLAVPYGGSGTLAGFILTDQAVSSGGGNATVPAVWHGRIILSNLPESSGLSAGVTGQFLLEA